MSEKINGGDSLVSSRYMQNDIFCAMLTQAHTSTKQTNPPQNTLGLFRGCGKQQKLNAETRDPPSQDPRDHKEQPSRHDIHPDTLKQTPTKPGRNESGETNYRSKTGE